MKSADEKEMERTQAEVRRLEKELVEARRLAALAWSAYVLSTTDGTPHHLPKS